MAAPRRAWVALVLGVGTGFAAAASPVAASPVAQAVRDFALLDADGRHHQLSRYGDRRALVLGVTSVDDERWLPLAERLMELRGAHSEDEVVVALLAVGDEVPRETLRERARARGLQVPILVDEARLVAQMLGVERRGELLVLAPASQDLLLRTTLLGSEDVERMEAWLAALLAGETPSSGAASSSGRGTRLDYPVRDAHRARPPSYARDVAPILLERCAGCHVQGGIGPWAMTDHDRVRGWSSMIADVVLSRRMPPGRVGPGFEEQFQDVGFLSAAEEQALLHWVEAGAPRDGELDPLTQQELRPPSWDLGEPDLLLEFEPQSIPATGVLDYIRLPVEIGHTEDLWIRALQFRPGAPQALHHLLIYLVPPGGTLENAPAGELETNLLAGYGPGKVGAQVLPEGTGRLIPVGATLLVQMHFTTNGKPAVDRTQLALYLHDGPPPRRLVTYRALNGRLRIPPFEREHPVRARTRPFPEDVELYSFTPHMHLRGKSMRYLGVWPNGERRVLLTVPDYDFNWQMKYLLKQPLRLPAGAYLVVEGAFDNSAMNLANPAPEKEITWGRESWDEMFIGYFNYSRAPAAHRADAGDQ